MEKKIPREMTGAELKSMLKSSINFKSLGGVKVPGLKLGPEDMQWWRDAKIGMFVHWGLYSLLGRGEWVRFNEQIPEKEYEALAEEFNPQNFSTDEWAQMAAEMGAKYMVMVTRHHDGFALWDSPGSFGQFTTAQTGSGRDFVAEYTESCRKAGLKVGYYYSPMDWRFPGYFDPEGLPENAALMKKQCYAQVEELVTLWQPRYPVVRRRLAGSQGERYLQRLVLGAGKAECHGAFPQPQNGNQSPLRLGRRFLLR